MRLTYSDMIKAGSIFCSTTISYWFLHYHFMGALAKNSTEQKDENKKSPLSVFVSNKRMLQQINGFSSPYDLTTLDGTNGFAVSGISQYGQLGSSVTTWGDINGDRIDDLLIGARALSNSSGAVYVIFGKTNGWQSTFNLNSLNGSNGFTISGLPGYSELGFSVTTADMNGDIIEDIIIGADGFSYSGLTSAGAVYVIFGQVNWPPLFNVMSLNGNNGFSIYGIRGQDQLGVSVDAADVNRDGRFDIIIGAPAYFNASSPGSAYVIFGKSTAWTPNFNLANLNGLNGFAINGLNTQDRLGISVSSAKDINNDGIDDIVFGSGGTPPSNRIQAGIVYIIFGQQTGWSASFNLSQLNGTNGFKIYGLTNLATLGYSVAGVLDVNGDGSTDLLVGAWPPLSGPPYGYGNVYVLFGRRNGWSSVFDLTTLNGMNGFSIGGIASNNLLGSSVVAADINGDEISDLILGAASPATGLGSVYVILGKQTNWSAQFNLTDLVGDNGFAVNSLAGGQSSCVGPAGDINNDGVADIVIGAPMALTSGIQYAGMTYVIFGKCSLLKLNQLTIAQNQTVTFSSTSNVNAYSLNSSLLSYSLASVQHGYFQSRINPGTALLNFTHANLLAQNIQFVHDGSINPPTYQVSASNGICRTPWSIGNLTFLVGGPPVLVNYSFTIARGKNIVLTNNNLAAYNPNPYGNSNATLLFLVSNLQHGHFGLTSNPRVAITQFMQQEIIAGRLMFTHDGNETSPAASVIVVNSFSLQSMLTPIQITFNPNSTDTTMVISEPSSEDSTGAIVGGAVAGVLVLGTIIAGTFWGRKRYQDGNTRKSSPLADEIRKALNLRGLDNFESEKGQRYLSVINKLMTEFANQGVTIDEKNNKELKDLAKLIASAAKNKITSSTTVFGYSIITVDDLNNKLTAIVQEVSSQLSTKDEEVHLNRY